MLSDNEIKRRLDYDMLKVLGEVLPYSVEHIFNGIEDEDDGWTVAEVKFDDCDQPSFFALSEKTSTIMCLN